MNRACLVFLGIAASLLAQPVSLSVSQIWTDNAKVAVYLYPRGENGLPAPAPSPSVTASVAGQTLQAASVETFNEGVAYILLADVSKSMRPEQYDQLRKAMQQFASGLTARDRMAIVSFGTEVQVVQDFTADAAALNGKLAALKPADDQTKLYLALSRALELGQRLDASLPHRRAIVVLTDGKDEGSGLNIDDLLQSIRAARVPVYGLGSSRLKEPEKKQHLDLLRRIAVNSGGDYFEVAQSFSESYDTIRKSILGVVLAQFDCSRCPRTGKPETWTFSLKSEEKVLAASTEITIQPAPTVAEVPVPTPQPAPAPVHPVRKAAPFIGGGFWIIVIIAIVARKRKRKAMLAAQQMAANQQMVAPQPVEEIPFIPSTPVMPPSPVIDKPAPPPPPQGLAVKLFVMRGQQRDVVHEFHLARPTSFGAGPSCGFSLPKESSLAPQQFELSYGNQRVLIRDLSGNATTTVNGVPIHGSHPLNHGDIIGAGGAEFRLLIGK